MAKRLLVINWRDIRNPEAGGAERYYHELFKRLARDGFSVTVLAHRFEGAALQEDQEGIRVIRVGGRLLFNFAVIPFLLRHQREYDLVIEDLNKLPFFTPLYVRRPRLHMVMHFFGSAIFQEVFAAPAAYVYVMEKLIPLVYRGESFLAISESTKKEIAAFGASPDRVKVVEPGIDTEFFHPTRPKSATPLLVCVSRLKKYKNVQLLIEALPEIRRRAGEVTLDLVGSGEYREALRSLADRVGASGSVRFLGYVDEETKRDLLSRATLFVNPSLKEGWGINNIEANLCGTISVSNDVPGLRDSVRHGQTGVLFRTNDREDFIDKVVDLLGNDEKRRTMEKQAAVSDRGFDWDVMAGRMRSVVEAALRRGDE